MSKTGGKQRKVLLGILLLLLLAAAANTVFVYYAFDKPSTSLTGGTMYPAAAGIQSVPVAGPDNKPPPQYGGPKLKGRVELEKRDDGKYTLTIGAYEGGMPVVVDGFTADIRAPDSDSAAQIPLFKKVGNGKYEATVSFPEPGRWEVRVRLNHDNEIIEFYERFDIQ